MKSIFNTTDRNEIISRINSLGPNNHAQWGTMTTGQMIRHCILCEEYYMGKVAVKRSLLGRMLGKIAIKAILKEGAIRKNASSPAQFKVTAPVQEVEQEKEKWKALIAEYGKYNHKNFVHWFFGPMTREQLGQFIYIHCNHHLKQFGV